MFQLYRDVVRYTGVNRDIPCYSLYVRIGIRAQRVRTISNNQYKGSILWWGK